jgi:hypothetical protein
VASTHTVSSAAVPQKTLMTFRASLVRDGRDSASSGHCERVSRLVAFATEPTLMEFLTFLLHFCPETIMDLGRSSP